MVKIYLKIAFRKLTNQKVYAFLNICGLAIGIAAFLLITMYVIDELTFDRYHHDYQQIFRITTEENTEKYVNTQLAVTNILSQNSSPIEAVAYLEKQFGIIVKANDRLFLEQGTIYQTTSDIFKVLTFKSISGDQSSAFQKPHQVAISENTARKYFNETNVTGQLIHFNETDWQICCVYRDIPKGSHLPEIHFLYNDQNAQSDPVRPWVKWVPTYLKISKGQSLASVERYLNSTIRQHAADPENFQSVYHLQAISAIHLDSDIFGDYAKTGNVSLLILLSSISILILILASLNFVNLSLVQSLSYAKSSGIQKIVGARQKDLIAQFLTETVILAGFSVLGGFLIVESVLPKFNLLVDKELSITLLHQSTFPVLVGSMILVILIAGLYPAIQYSAVNPLSILKKQPVFQKGRRLFNLRNALIIIQFTASIVLIIASLVIVQQLTFMQNSELGFHKEDMLVIPTQTQLMAEQYHNNLESIKTEFVNIPGVQTASGHLSIPGQEWRMDWIKLTETNFEPNHPFIWEFVDYDYLDTYEIPLIAGRNFDRKITSDDCKTMIINETAARQLGFVNPVDAVGNHVSNWMGEMTIIGVVRDFHTRSLHYPIEPLMFSVMTNLFPETLTLKLDSENIQQTLINIETVWKQLFPNFPFTYFFLNDDFSRQYNNDQVFKLIILVFTILSIIIALLGQIGLIAMMTKQRTKEIGIRKVLGASANSISRRLSVDLLACIGIANLIAWPLAYLIMENWLRNFAYKSHLSIFPFILTGLLSIGFSWFIISLWVYRAAKTNPVDSLRYE